jgi:hypothetical protein
MWLKSALQNHYGITRKGHSGHLNKTIDELLNKIILMDCAEYYSQKVNFGFYRNTSPKASMKIDFDNNAVDVKILMKYYTHKSSNIHKLYDFLSIEKEYDSKINDMFYEVHAYYIDENAIGISFKYDKDEVLK